MPRRKHWRKSDSKRRERSRTDESETTVTGKYTESPGRNQARSPGRNQARSPGRNQARSPGRNQARSPGRNQARSPERMPAKSPEKKQAALEKPVHSNKSDKLVQKEKVHSKNEEFQCSDFFKSLTASDSSNSQTSFDAVFMDTFPDVVANYQSRDKELSERERIAFSPVNTSQQNEELKRNVTAQHQLSNDPLEVCSDNDVACYQAIKSSELLWNASDLVFGSFHQNDGRFSEHSRGYQCTCNALCMLSYAHCGDVDNSMVLDKVLCEGDALYQTVIRKLKSDGKFIHHLLSLEEIPDDFEVEIGKFTLEKLRIVSGPLIDTQDLGFPTLHEVLQSAFLSVSSGLLTIGAICSAVFKKKGSYAFFDSHCHGHNGLSATDGASCLMTFSSLDDLVTYMYAFYDSMKLDTNLQYDFLPINVKMSQNKQSYKDEMASHMQAYFNDQRLRQANKLQSEVRSIANDLASISIEKSKKALGAKRNKLQNRTEYFKTYMRKYRQFSAFKAKERESSNLQEGILFLGQKKQCIRRNQSNLQEKTLSLKQKKDHQSNLQEGILFSEPKKLCIRRNQSNLREKTLSLKQKKDHQSNLQEKTLSLKQKKENQSNLQEGILFLGQKKQCIRRNQSNLQEKTLSLKQKKDHQSNLQEGILFSEPKKLCIRRNQSNLREKTLSLKQKKDHQSNLQEKTLSLKQKKDHQSNLQEKTLSLKQKKENQSSFLEKILFSRLKKLCIKRNQSRERGKIRLLKSKKKKARISQKKGQGKIHMFLNVRELRSNK